MKSLKKKITVICILGCVLGITGCGKKKVTTFMDSNTINVEHTSEKEMARINIEDSYTKDSVRYYVITSDVSGTAKFTLSEDDYDKYIGLENDAVDCTIYNLELQSDVCEYKYNPLFTKDLPYNTYTMCDFMDAVPKIIDGKMYCAADSIFWDEDYYILKTSDSNGNEVCFDLNSQFYSMHISSFPGQRRHKQISSKMELKRYSFAGEKDFSEDEICTYKDVMVTVNTDICNEIEKK